MSRQDNPSARPLAPPTNLTGMLIARLTDEIVEGKLAPRTRLPTEQALMQAYGVSRTVVREAIAALRAEGIVETRQGSGAFVANDSRKRPFRIDPEGLHSVNQVIEVLELRICVEVEAAGLAAARRTKADLMHLRAVARRFAKAVAEGDPAVEIDFDFHVGVGAATQNPYFSSFLSFLGAIVIPRRSVHLAEGRPAEHAQYLQNLRREHDTIAEAIADGDAAAARQAMHAHLERGRKHYRRIAENGAS